MSISWSLNVTRKTDVDQMAEMLKDVASSTYVYTGSHGGGLVQRVSVTLDQDVWNRIREWSDKH